MAGNLLFILVEGDDDERYFEKIIKPLLQRKYSQIRIWKYSKKEIKKRKSLIRSLQSMKADFIYVTDINEAPCITFKKEDIYKRLV